MNQVIQGTVKELEHRYELEPDDKIIWEIITGRHQGVALFYLLFGRYVDMLRIIYNQQGKTLMDFDDFMLELDIRLYAHECAAIRAYDPTKASFKTYLSHIAHNLAYDLHRKELPTIDSDIVNLDMPFDDANQMKMLIDAINSYPDKESRYVLLKTIEGYKSKEIATMLTSKRQADGELALDEDLKPSYIDTLRSRALKAIRRQIEQTETRDVCFKESYPKKLSSCLVIEEAPSSASGTVLRRGSTRDNLYSSSLFIKNIRKLYNQIMEIEYGTDL